MFIRSSTFLLFFVLHLWTPNLTVAQAIPTNLPWVVQELDHGLVWKQLHTEALFNGWQHLNLLEIHPKKHRLSLGFVVDTLIKTSEFGPRGAAKAAVNAGFFNMQKGGSVSLLKVQGQVVNTSTPKHIADKSVVLTGAILLGPGKRVRVEAGQPDSVYFSKKYPNVLLTGPLLLAHNIPVALANTPFNTNRHPRTSMCVTDQGTVLLLTADGRNNQALGLTLPELTTLMQRLGCKDAVNLDGGGSTTMWIDGQPFNGVVNMPSDNKQFDHLGERNVANAILVH